MDKLSDHLKRSGLTQAAFAELIGTTQPVVSRLVAGTMQPGAEMAARIDVATGGAVRFIDWPAFSVFRPLLEGCAANQPGDAT